MAQDDFEEFAKRVKQAESGGRRFDARGNLLTSPKGAQGEMQVMPATQRSPGFGVEPARTRHPQEIARVGKDYLRAMEQRYGNKEYAAVAYNWGPGKADKWIAEGADFAKLPKETQDYVNKVLGPRATDQPAAAPGTAPEAMPDHEAIGRGQMTADLGSGYKAALALSFLGDEEDSDEKKLDEEEKQAAKALAEHKSFNALNELEFAPTKVPMLTAQAQPPVQGLAEGGVPYTPTATIRPSAKQQLADIKAQYDVYNTNATAYNDALKKYQTDVYDPYMAQVDAYNKAAEAWNAGPRTSEFGMAAPTAPAEFSMTAPTAPTTTQEQYTAMGEAAKRDAAHRNLALQVASNPEQFGLSINKMFADGGDVSSDVPEPWLPKVSSYSQMTAYDMYPGQQGQFDQQDAARHMLAAGTLARKYGPGVAEALGQAHEITTSPLRWIGSKLGISQMPVDYEQDLHNNRVGIELAARSKSQKELEDLVQREAERARSQQTPGTAWIGKPVRRAEGSSETGEEGDFRKKLGMQQPPPEKQGIDWDEVRSKARQMLIDMPKSPLGAGLEAAYGGYKLLTGTQPLEDMLQRARRANQGLNPHGGMEPVFRADGSPEGGERALTPEEIEAASKPATFNPQIARQGAAARQLAAMRDVNTLPDPRTYAAVSGFLGTPPNQQGFSVMHPDIEGIKRAGDVGFVAGTAAQVAPAVGAVRNLVGKGTTEAARALEGLKNIPVGASTKAVEPIFQHLPSAEAPFVGRLDEFVAGLPSNVQKDQFLGMLKGKFRDYDMGRAQEALADLPGNAKLTPSDLLNRIKGQYDPGQFRTTVLPPGKPGDYYQSMDNIYYDKHTDVGPTLGVIHLSQDLSPAMMQKQLAIKNTGLAISRLASQWNWAPISADAADALIAAVKNPAIPLSESTASQMLGVARDIKDVATKDAQWEQAKNRMLYPILEKDYDAVRDSHLQQLLQERPGVSKWDLYKDADRRTAQQFAQEANQWLISQGHAPAKLPDYAALDNPLLFASSDKNAASAVTDAFDKARESTLAQFEDIKERAKEARRMFGEDTRAHAPYMGQHTSLGNLPNPISFSRFSEQTAEIPGMGKLEGIYVNELQSDLLDDLRKFGPKGGTADKDILESEALWKLHVEAGNKAQAAADEGNMALSEQFVKERDKYAQQAEKLLKRASRSKRGEEGMYGLEQAFAGMEQAPQATQQLMAKNAIIGAIQQGKSFVAFPGLESAQSQLYEKLPHNLKSVVKDLGPGFELRPVTLTDATGRRVMHNAVVWSPEAAARLQKKGVPFKTGGLVERRTDDSRKYM